MTTLRNIGLTGAVAALALLAGCATGGPGSASAQPVLYPNATL